MTQAEQLRKDQHADQTGKHTGNNSNDYGFQILFQKFHLLIQRNCQADRCRCEQVADILTALIIGVIINMQ